MSLFSEVFKEYQERTKVSLTKLAKETGVSRERLRQYLTERQTPSDIHEIEILGKGMMLPPKDREHLAEAFYKTKYGDKSFESIMYIKAFLENKNRYFYKKAERQEEGDKSIEAKEFLKESMVFYGQHQVARAIFQIIRKVCVENSEKLTRICMLVQPEEQELIRSVLLSCIGENVEVEHIICLERDRNNNNNLSSVLSVLEFEFSDIKYHSRYYYDRVDSHTNSMSLLPNMILVGDYVFLCNYEMDECLILAGKDKLEFYNRQYKRMRDSSEILMEPVHSVKTLAELSNYISQSAKNNVFIGFAPCLTLGIDEKIYREHLRMSEKEVCQVIQVMGESKERLLAGERFCDYFTEAGLRQFMETGKLSDYPEIIYIRPDKEMRRVVLGNMIEVLKLGHFHAYMAVDEKLKLADFNNIYVNVEGDIQLWCRTDGYGKAALINEPSIRDSIYLFQKYAMENGWFYDERETIVRMQRILEEY